MATPSIACIGIIGKHDNPLHIALFPPHSTDKAAYLEFSFLLNASLDVFDARTRDRNRVDQDLGMLQAVDERLSIWGWQTGTGTKFAIVVDAWGRGGRSGNSLEGSVGGSGGRGRGVGDGDVKVAFKALQTAYIRLLQNPFYAPDDHTPMAVAAGKGKGGQITSKNFIREVKRIGDAWRPGNEDISNLDRFLKLTFGTPRIMTEILVDLPRLTVKLNVDSPITTYQLEEFLEDYYGIDGEVVLLYQHNPYGSRHYRCGRRPELAIGDGETSANVAINGVPKILQGVAKVQPEFEMLENRESLGKRKRTLDSTMPPDAKRGRHYFSTGVERPTITDEATETAELLVASAAPSASSFATRQSSVTAGLYPEATRGAASSARGRSVRGIRNPFSAEGNTERAVASIEAKKGLHLTVGWTGMD